VAEVPIVFVDRAHGQSKMSRSVVTEALLRVTEWGTLGWLARLRRAVPGTRR
jgi:dolichol-phosphate mannosyltransferase